MEITNIKESRNIIEDVVLGSIADELGVDPGDILVSINGKEVKDVIDYRYLIADEILTVVIDKKNGEEWELEIEKEYSEDIGIIFTNPLIDKAKTCQNKCMFCFIDQLPPNMRDTLYFKDDDSRLSFLQGNFITLTNMKEDDIQRIIDYKLSPINVSVHTTNSELRIRMLRNKNAGKIFDILRRFHEANLEMNCQIVLIPEVNDGEELQRTIRDLSTLYPSINSIAVVPVGITKYRNGLDDLEIYNKETASALLNEVAAMQDHYLESHNTRFVFASDEFYCVSNRDIPSYDEYEGFPQYENGVGLMRSFSQELEDALIDLKITNVNEARILIATGKLAEGFIQSISRMIMDRVKGLIIEVVSIRNDFFGETITVSGLVTGNDLVDQIRGRGDYDAIFIPRSMMKRDEDVFLDNLTYDQANFILGRKLKLAPVDGNIFLEMIMKEVRS
jgi:putative radical SAM enzyme (TIGR03279 family)